MSKTVSPYSVRVKYLNERDGKETLDLDQAGYDIEDTTPCMLRVWGTDKEGPEITMLIPLERVFSLTLMWL